MPDTVVDAGTVAGGGRLLPGRNSGHQCLGKHHGPQVDSVYDHNALHAAIIGAAERHGEDNPV